MIKTYRIFLQSIPTIIMIALIPLVQNDYVLAAIHLVLIIVLLTIRRDRADMTVLIFGFCVMIVSEYVFISTGVETFVRNSLFGLMPVWLPFLWGWGFVAIKRSIIILTK